MALPIAAGALLAPVATQIAADAGVQLFNVSAKKLVQAVRAGTGVSSLADLSRPARVEPLVIIDQTLADQPFMTDIMKTTLSIFTGYYMQAAAILGMKVGRIDVLKTLDVLNPNRSVGSAMQVAKDAVWSKEHYAEGLPSLEAFEQPMERHNLIVSVEADKESEASETTKKAPGQALSVDGKSIDKLYEVDNLVVGKMVNVELRDGDQSAKLPVMIRLVPSYVPAKVLTHIFTATARSNSWTERFHLWRAGQIRLVRDLMFGLDLIDEHRRALMNDTSNVYMAVSKRRSGNLRKASLTNAPSMADASNIAIVSKQTAKDMGRTMGGRLESVTTRKKLFDETYLMLLVVVDEQWERVTIYHRGIDEPTEASVRELKSSEKGKGPDITEILKAYALGSSPSI